MKIKIENRIRTKIKILKFFLMIIIFFMASIDISQAATVYEISDGNIIIDTAGDYVILGEGTQTSNYIEIAPNISVNLTISNVNIEPPDGLDASALKIGSYSTVTLTLIGTNNLLCASDANAAGLNVPRDAILTITEESTGTLFAKGYYGSGIGGNSEADAGTMNINGGHITAVSEYGAGIGGGDSSGDSTRGATVNINGGTVIATSVIQGAGIGGGGSNENTTVNINGGVVTATGGRDGAGIGGGIYNLATTVNINGGTVIANGGDNCVGIGGGYRNDSNYYPSFVNVHITGGTVTANGGSIAADIGTNSDNDNVQNVVGVHITGGLVNAEVFPVPYDEASSRVFPVTITGIKASSKISYKVDGGNSILCESDSNGKIYLWLPSTGVPTHIEIKAVGEILYAVSATVETTITSSSADLKNTFAATELLNASAQPADLLLRSTENGTIPLEINATGISTLSYQWFSNSEAQNSGGTEIIGATGSIYLAPTDTVGKQYYYCQVMCTYNSELVKLETYAISVKIIESVIEAQPSDLAVCAGEVAKLEVIAASVGSNALTYQWYRNVVDSNMGGIVINGAINSTYTAPSNAYGNVYYYCIVTDTGTVPATVQTSEVAEVAVVGVTITVNPSDIGTLLGNDAELITNATGAGTINYQWYRNTVDSNSNGTLISGATSGSYFAPTTSKGTLFYYCRISDSKGFSLNTKYTDSIAVTVVEDTSTYLKSLSINGHTLIPVFDKSIFSFDVNTAWNTSNLELVAEPMSSFATLKINGISATSGSVTTVNLEDDVNKIVIEVTGANGGGIMTYTVNVNRDAITSQPTDVILFAVEGSKTTLSITATGSPALQYQWYRTLAPDNTGGTEIVGATASTYLAPADTVGTVYYYCTIRDTYNSVVYELASDVASVKIVGALIETQPTDFTVCVDDIVTLEILAAGVGTESVTYQWYKNTEDSNLNGIAISAANQRTYLAPTHETGIVYYYCVVTDTGTNPVNSQTSDVISVVVVGVNITSQPTDMSALLGNPVTLSTTATGTGTLSYQWYRHTLDSNHNGTLISGATNTTYVAPSTAVGSAYYYCGITDAVGSVVDTQYTDSVTVIIVEDTSTYLKNLSINGHALIPNFDKNTLTFNVNTAWNTSRLELVAEPMSSMAAMTINGISATSGSAVNVNIENGVNKIVIEVTGANGGGIMTYTVNVNRGASLSIENTCLSKGIVGSSYSETLIVEGGVGPYSWSTTSALPGNFILNSDGTITGMPLNVDIGTYPIEITVTDSTFFTVTKTIDLKINLGCGNGGYSISSDNNTAYSGSYNEDGIAILTVNSDVSGFVFFSVNIAQVTGHAGEEVCLFVHIRNGEQIGFSFLKADFDTVKSAGAAYNVRAGDIIKVYIVDTISNEVLSNPIVL